jgi:hypothetical protein
MAGIPGYGYQASKAAHKWYQARDYSIRCEHCGERLTETNEEDRCPALEQERASASQSAPQAQQTVSAPVASPLPRIGGKEVSWEEFTARALASAMRGKSIGRVVGTRRHPL